MFNNPFNFAMVRDTKQGIGFYLTFWLFTMIGSLVFSLPTTVWWGTIWQSSPTEYFKLVIAGSHSVCALFSLYLSLEVAKAKNVDKSKLVLLLSVLFAIISGAFASPTTPIFASVLSSIDNGQNSVNRKQLIIFSIVILIAFIVYFISKKMNQG